MKNKETNKKSNFQTKAIKNSFSGNKLNKICECITYNKLFNQTKLGKVLNDLFPNEMFNSTKFINVQVLLSYLLNSLPSVSRM